MVLLDSNKVNEQHSSQAKHSRCLQVVRQIISGLKCPGVMTGNIRKFIIKMFSSAVLYYFLTIFNKAINIKILMYILIGVTSLFWAGTTEYPSLTVFNLYKQKMVYRNAMAQK